MAIHLLPPVYNQLPFFQANQVLTYGHLNDMANYLYQQERYTRNKTIGTGIVCGLTYRWQQAATKAQVIIDEGIGITSAGYLIVFQQPVLEGVVVPYTHRRNFNRLSDFPPFDNLPNPANTPIYELITQTEFDEEQLVPKSELMHADRTNRVLILLFDPEVLNVAKCLDEGCDDKGKIYRFRVRALLVPKPLMEAATALTEAGRGWKAREAVQSDIRFMRIPSLWNGVNLSAIGDANAFANMYVGKVTNALLDEMAVKMEKLLGAYPWLFGPATECLKDEIAALAGSSLPALFKSRAVSYRDAAAKRVHIQFLYDFLRDIADAYNELAECVMELAAQCGGDEKLYPFHLMLGLPQTNETLTCTKEEKFKEPHHRFRHPFVPSPVMDSQWHLTEKIILLHKRLARMIDGFDWSTRNANPKISPSLDFDNMLGKRALPAYYDSRASNPLLWVWNPSFTQHNQIEFIQGYAFFNQNKLLEHDLAKNNFFRIEGVTGRPFADVLQTINDLRKQYMLPFGVMALPLLPIDKKEQQCSWPDLQEEFLYYRDRVLGYLREIKAWLPTLTPFLVNVLDKKTNEIEQVFGRFMELLENARCIEDFPYQEWKRNYTVIWSWLFLNYAKKQSADQSTIGAFHYWNSVFNISNLILFAPLYKIWFAFRYRQSVLQATGENSFQQLSAQFMGLEHLAGVRRGHTFLLVYDSANQNVIGDFNMPDLQSCGCDCKVLGCNGEQRVLVSPMEKPILMVVYPYNDQFSALQGNLQVLLSKIIATYEPEPDTYVLRLDEMGFYKADSQIDPEINLMEETGKKPEDLVANWEKDQFVVRFKFNQKDGENTGGVRIFQYQMKGDFSGPVVEGVLILIIAGVLERAVAANERDNIFEADIAAPNKTSYYPYDTEFAGKRKTVIEVAQPTKQTTIGRDKVRVFTTPAGNKMGIYTDKKGQDYLKLVEVKNPVVEEIPFVLRMGDDQVKSKFTVNISDKKEKLETPNISGIIKDQKGMPLENVRIVTGTGKEAITNNKGEYTLEGVKAGEILRVERKDFETVKLQVNTSMPDEIGMKKETTTITGALDNITIPDSIKNLTKGLNLNIKTRIPK